MWLSGIESYTGRRLLGSRDSSANAGRTWLSPATSQRSPFVHQTDRQSPVTANPVYQPLPEKTQPECTEPAPFSVWSEPSKRKLVAILARRVSNQDVTRFLFEPHARSLIVRAPGGQPTYRWLMLAAVLGLATNVGCWQVSMRPQESPKGVVEHFYKQETEGRWLGPERWDELQDLLTEVRPWSPPRAISVIRNYKLGDAARDKGPGGLVDYQVEVDLFEWGSINSFLNFTRARGPRAKNVAVDEPVERQTYESIVLTDRFLKRSPSGDEEKIGARRWRITLFALPSLGVEAALRWVAQMRDKSNDPVIRYNAERTITILRSLSDGRPAPIQPTEAAKESPADTARRFVQLEGDLMPGRMTNLAEFFVETPNPQWEKVFIVDIVGASVDANGDSAEVTVSTNVLGDLDKSLRLSNYPSMRLPLDVPSASACFGDFSFGFTMLLSHKHWETGADGTVKELDGAFAWRVEDAHFTPLVTLDTAIRYVGQAREKTTDRVVKMNAARTLTILEYYRRGKPLPVNLCSETSHGCG